MLDYDNEMSNPKQRSSIPMQVEEEAKDVFECTSVTIKKWSEAIDTNISSAFSNLSHNNKDSRNEVEVFSEALLVRGEISKICASINSFSIANDSLQYPLFDGYSTTTIDNLEAIISPILGAAKIEKVHSIISAINDGKPNSPSASTLSKLCLVYELLAEGVLDQNTKLCRQSANNVMLRQFSTNDCML